GAGTCVVAPPQLPDVDVAKTFEGTPGAIALSGIATAIGPGVSDPLSEMIFNSTGSTFTAYTVALASFISATSTGVGPANGGQPLLTFASFALPGVPGAACVGDLTMTCSGLNVGPGGSFPVNFSLAAGPSTPVDRPVNFQLTQTPIPEPGTLALLG